MKKAIIPFLLLALLVSACAAGPQPTTQPTEPTTGQVTDAPTSLPTEVPTEAPTEIPTTEPPKILLKLRQFEPDRTQYEGTEAETEEAPILLEDLALPETGLKPYEHDPFLAPIAAVLEQELGLTLDGSWQFYIHYYTQEQDMGIVAMTYWIDGVIATNRAVTIPIEKGTARTVIYSYLDRPLDEEALLNKYEVFRSTHEQERVNLLGEDYEIDAESTLYSYNFRTGQLTYTYNIFYREKESGIVINDYGTEMVIE